MRKPKPSGSGKKGKSIPAHREHAGGWPVILLPFKRLNPNTLGKLVALYEHKVFVQGVIWGINAFDQRGVELGKELAVRMLPSIGDTAANAGKAPSLEALLKFIRRLRESY